jgi:tRNA A-37 threonylcarbamoyl transferase component Bud32
MSVEVDLKPPFERLIGQTLASRYKIESRIGEGAMGAVYRAKHVKVGRVFAVKVLHPRLLEEHKTLQRFEREAELAGRLRHPNVIGVVDVGETPDGLRYMVMEFAAGPDLATLLSDAPYTPPRIIHLVRQLLEGLYHAHEAGLIHRDFKPENVIIEKDTHGNEVPRIVDFGIAILREGGDSPESPGRLTTNGLVLGTPHYMAPEQAVADPIDHRIDLFALGIMIYEMLCGKLPFDGTGAEVARANLLLDPPRISKRVPHLDVDVLLEAFARKLMAKKRENRPATAKAARELLDLIERDRTAAAKALGVPLDIAREPATTEPSAAIRHVGDHDGTFPPPIREAEGKQAPAMQAVKAVPARVDTFTTDQTPPKRRAPLIAAGVVGLAIIAGAGALLLGGDDEKPAPTTTAQAPQPPAPQPPAEPKQPEPAKVEAPVQAPPVEAPPLETPATNDGVTNAANAKQTKAAPKKIAKTNPVTKSTVTTTTPTPTKTTVTTAAPPPVENKAVDAGALASQYKTVGAQLKALQDAKGADAVSDLWSRYRFIRLSDAMSTQEKRDEAAAILSKLATEAAARKR